MVENALHCHQVMLENQNRRIDDLLERIRLQQEKLDKQNVRIRTLQSQVGGRFNAHTHNADFSVLLFSPGVFFGLTVRFLGLFQVQSRKSSSTDASVEQSDSPIGK